MYYPSEIGQKFFVQQTVTGGNGFDGTEFGRARLSFGGGIGDHTTVWLAAKKYGATANALTMEFRDMGAGTVVLSTSVQQSGSALVVILRRSVGGLLATAAEVAAAINAFTPYSNPYVQTYNSPALAIRARAEGDGLGVVAAHAATSFTGGVDATNDGSQFLWTPTGNAGFFHFEQDVPVWVLGFAARFTIGGPGPYTVSVKRVRLLDDFTPVLTEAVGWFYYSSLTPSAPDIAYADVKQLLHPKQGLLVTTSSTLAGFVSFDVTRAGEYPYAG